MKEETKNWLKQARKDLKKATILRERNQFDGVTFYAQQTAEKALKSVYIYQKNDLLKTHDLSILGREVNLPNNLLEMAALLNPFYISSRYPLTIEDKNLPDEEDADNSIKYAREILKWCKQQIKI